MLPRIFQEAGSNKWKPVPAGANANTRSSWGGIKSQRMVHFGRCRCRRSLSPLLPPPRLWLSLGSWGTCRRSLASLRMICRHRSTKASSTLALLRALVSKYGVFHSRDVAKAFGRGIARSSSRSDLLPTSTIGTLSSSLIRLICSRSSASSWNDDADVMAKTRRNPCPVFMYSSLYSCELHSIIGPNIGTSWQLYHVST